jgi:hypothetical protein
MSQQGIGIARDGRTESAASPALGEIDAASGCHGDESSLSVHSVDSLGAGKSYLRTSSASSFVTAQVTLPLATNVHPLTSLPIRSDFFSRLYRGVKF